jgi:hypothetical protein
LEVLDDLSLACSSDDGAFSGFCCKYHDISAFNIANRESASEHSQFRRRHWNQQRERKMRSKQLKMAGDHREEARLKSGVGLKQWGPPSLKLSKNTTKFLPLYKQGMGSSA